MTHARLELAKKQLENALIILSDIDDNINTSDKSQLLQIKDYAITILCFANRLL